VATGAFATERLHGKIGTHPDTCHHGFKDVTPASKYHGYTDSHCNYMVDKTPLHMRVLMDVESQQLHILLWAQMKMCL